MENFNNILSEISGYVWGMPMILLLLGTHIWLTVRLRFPQRHLLKAIRLSLSKEKGTEGEVSQFGALSTALAATIGTGNIIGVGTAIALGGPGAVFWCWITGVLGIATKYGEALLAVKYRVNSNGRMLGGPMYAIEGGLASSAKGLLKSFWKIMAIAFAFFTAVATFGIGSTVQANAISTMSNNVYGFPPVVIGGIVTILAAGVIMGGIRSIAKCCQALVPIMSGVYVLGCITILLYNASFVWPAIKLIVESAFEPSAAGGGFVGASIMMTARYGIARGLFSNESGLGSAPIVAATAQTKNPVRQALVSSTATFWDTVVICAITGITIVSSILAYPDMNFNDGGELTRLAFSKIPVVGEPILVFGAITFAFSTILGWGYYGERGVEFLYGKWLHSRKKREITDNEYNQSIHKIITAYRVIYLITVYLGSIISLNAVWNLADIFNALMTVPNLLCLLFLSGIIVKETKKYLWNDNLDTEG